MNTRGELHVSIQATFGGYPCRISTLGPASASVEQALPLPEEHRAHLSFHAAGEWFHLVGDVESSSVDRELTLEAARPVYRTVVHLRNVQPQVATHLSQLLYLLALDQRSEPIHTEALQFEIVGA